MIIGEYSTILKDASTTAVYGLKGANGVLVDKDYSRTGRQNLPLTLQLKVVLIGAIKMPTILDAYTTASLYNEAQLMMHMG